MHGDDDLEPSHPYPSIDPALAKWKHDLRERFEAWLDSIDTIPKADEEPHTPDLYSFYEELAALRAESRKGNRKSAELFSQFGESLGGFDEEMKRLRAQLTRLGDAQPVAGDLPRSHCLALVETLDRLQRLGAAVQRTPKRERFAVFRPDAAWEKAWHALRQGFDILLTHLESLIRQAGIRRLVTVGKAFDPTAMVAVAAVEAQNVAANTVVEEMAPGYALRDEVLRPAEVKISKLIP